MGAKESMNPKVPSVVERFKERGSCGNLGSIPGIEPRSKRDIGEGESILSLFIMMTTMRHSAFISGQARQFGVVPVKAT